MTRLDEDAMRMYIREVVVPQARKETFYEFALPLFMVGVGAYWAQNYPYNEIILGAWIFFWALGWNRLFYKLWEK